MAFTVPMSVSCPMRKSMTIFSWILQVAAAVILAQTLFFKFTGAPEAKHIFTTLGVEPWGRIGTGVAELIAAILLLIPRTAIFGAVLGVGLMVGAVASHLGPLGVVVLNDKGLLFSLALIVLTCSVGILAIRRREVFALVARFRKQANGV